MTENLLLSTTLNTRHLLGHIVHEHVGNVQCMLMVQIYLLLNSGSESPV